jgi:hypothetical protein
VGDVAAGPPAVAIVKQPLPRQYNSSSNQEKNDQIPQISAAI